MKEQSYYEENYNTFIIIFICDLRMKHTDKASSLFSLGLREIPLKFPVFYKQRVRLHARNPAAKRIQM